MDEDTKKEIKASVEDNILRSSILGFPQIAFNFGENLILTIFWTICTLAAIGVSAYLVVDSIITYYEYEVITKIRVKYETSIVYPSITICNINFFTTQNANTFLKSIVNEFDQIDDNFLLFYPTQKALLLNTTELKKLGDSLSKLVQVISIGKKEANLTEKNFKYFFSTIYGNCYTLLPYTYEDGTEIEPIKAIKPGLENGIAFLYNFSLVPDIFDFRQGGIVFIHENGSFPTYGDALTIEKGSYVNLGLRVTKSETLPKPYSSCDPNTGDPNEYDSRLFKSTHKSGYKYSQKLCIDLCFHELMLKNCSCYFYFLTSWTSGRPCLNNSEFDCTVNLYDDFINSNLADKLCKPQCPLECTSTAFTKTVSFSTSKTLENSDASYLNLYYEEFYTTEIDETPTMNIPQLLANIGGNIGLFLGISVLSLMEIVSILIEIIQIIFGKNRIKEFEET
ncbi:unnamed protein product [Brachionus calyciflorus]|uniref:Uncharacterized protein n=1 Tax=Brachionus calyciflorus TaxID=104777 RepID=A0A813QXQ8_9BILA|nr:unnamed protein product [Brachionus calyciflorus]